MMFSSQPHHDGSARYLDDGVPDLGDRLAARIRVPASLDVAAIHVRTVVDGEPEFTEASVIEREPGDDGAVWWQGDVNVGNPHVSYRFLLDTASGPRWVNGSGTWTRDVPDRDDFVVSTYEPPPDWLAGAVAYEIFPDRFARSGRYDTEPAGDWAIESSWDDPVANEWKRSVRQLYRGDLTGVRERLDHIEQLGANLIYLTPVFPGGSSHRYDAAEFDRVDPVLGGDQALAALVDAAHARGIRIIGDLTTNHSGNHHEWFRAAQADATSEEAGFYFFTDHPDGYIGWFDVETLPKFDLRSRALRVRLVDGPDSIVGRWLGGADGLDGWRIDVGNMTGRLGAIDVNHDVFRDVRSTMAAVNPDTWLLGEHCHDATADLRGDGWHGVMAYTWFTRPLWSWLTLGATADLRLLGIPGPFPAIGGDGLADTYAALTAGVPWRSVAASMTLLDSHDTPRFASAAMSAAHQRVGIGLLMTMPGVPMVFAGDEVGVVGADRDLARQPFPWDDSRWDRDLLATYRELIALRRSTDALQHGGLRWVAAGADTVAFVREAAGERILVHAARASHDPVTMRAGDLGLGGGAERLYGEGALDVADGRVTLTAGAPAVTIWRAA